MGLATLHFFVAALILISILLYLALIWPTVVEWELRRRARAKSFRNRERRLKCYHYAPATPPQREGGPFTCPLCGCALGRSWEKVSAAPWLLGPHD